MPKQPPMTNEEYMAAGGNQCPFCRSVDIQGGSVETESCRAWQNVSCDECNHSWQDEYVMTGWTDEHCDNPSDEDVDDV